MTLTDEDRDEIMGICIRRENVMIAKRNERQDRMILFVIACGICSFIFFNIGVILGKIL